MHETCDGHLICNGCSTYAHSLLWIMFPVNRLMKESTGLSSLSMDLHRIGARNSSKDDRMKLYKKIILSPCLYLSFVCLIVRRWYCTETCQGFWQNLETLEVWIKKCVLCKGHLWWVSSCSLNMNLRCHQSVHPKWFYCFRRLMSTPRHWAITMLSCNSVVPRFFLEISAVIHLQM